jgi:hypothetical protein
MADAGGAARTDEPDGGRLGVPEGVRHALYEELSPSRRARLHRRIGEALVIGERTVEMHVSNVLGKLGFVSRAQVAVWAVERRIAVAGPDPAPDLRTAR